MGRGVWFRVLGIGRRVLGFGLGFRTLGFGFGFRVFGFGLGSIALS